MSASLASKTISAVLQTLVTNSRRVEGRGMFWGWLLRRRRELMQTLQIQYRKMFLPLGKGHEKRDARVLDHHKTALQPCWVWR